MTGNPGTAHENHGPVAPGDWFYAAGCRNAHDARDVAGKGPNACSAGSSSITRSTNRSSRACKTPTVEPAFVFCFSAHLGPEGSTHIYVYAPHGPALHIANRVGATLKHESGCPHLRRRERPVPRRRHRCAPRCCATSPLSISLPSFMQTSIASASSCACRRMPLRSSTSH